MLRISLFGLFYSVYQIPVNEAPFLSVDPGLEIDDLSTDAFEQSFELGYAPFFLLFSAWLLAYKKLQKAPGTFQSESPEIGVAPAAKGSPKFSPREVPGQTCPPPKAVPKCPPRAKAKGKAPPPKGTPPRKASASKAGEATPTAKAAANPFGARRVRWRTLQSAAGTIFDGLGTGQLRNETARMLNEVFRVTPQGQSAKSSPFIPKSSGVCLLNPKRAQQLAIVFRRSPVPLQKLCSALLALDFSVLGHLGEEEIDGLLQAWPTSFDFQLVEKYKGPIQELRDVEQCIKQMSAVPRSEARLKLLRLSRSLDGLGHFLEQFKLLRCACEELLNSKTLRLLLEEALTMGNYINGDAGAGFSLDAFSHLKSLKGAAGTTALHCLCASCAQEDPCFCSKLAAELQSLRSASQISLGTLNEALQCIKIDVESAAMEFANHASEYDSTPAIAELQELPPAPIQPLGSSKLGLPCKIPPLHLQMLQAEPLAVTFEHSGEEDTSSSRDESHVDGPEIGARSSRTPRAQSVNSRTHTDATSASKSPRASPKASPKASPQRSPSCSVGAARTPARVPEPPAKPLRFVMPPLRLPAKEVRPNGLCTPRRPHGSMIREAPPLRSARGGQADDTPRSLPSARVVQPVRAAPAPEEDAWRLYLEGLPAVTPRCPAPLLTARSEARGFANQLCSPLSSCVPGVPPRAAEAVPQAVSVFIRNVTMSASDIEKCCNATERFLCQKTSNGTCGIPAPVWSEVGCNGTAPLSEGPLRNGTCIDREGERDSSSPSSAGSSGGPRAQLHALVARGRILLKRNTQDVAEMSKAINNCERFFGGLSTDAKDGGVPLLSAAAEVLNAFQQAWEEVHRDDRWARFLPMTSVRTTARSEVSTSRRRKFTPRRSLP